MAPVIFDFIIIGGGLAGCALAYQLAHQKMKVLLLEAGSLCSGSSAACAGRAQFIEGLTHEYLTMIKAGYSKLSGLAQELDTDLEWQTPGHLTLLDNESQWQEYHNLTNRLNQMDISAEMLSLSEVRKAEPALHGFSGIGAAFSQEGHLNPFRLVFAYAKAAKQLGATLRTHTPVRGFTRNTYKIEEVQCGVENFQAAQIIFASGAWSRQILKMIGVDLPMQFTHAEALITEPLPPLLHHHIGFSGFYHSVHGEQHSIALGIGQHSHGSLLISNAIQPMQEIQCKSSAWGITTLMKSFSTYFPQLNSMHILRSWSAPSPFLPDSLPVIGFLPGFENAYVAAGFHLAISTIPYFSQLVADTLTKNENSELQHTLASFNPQRFSEHSWRLQA